MKEVYTNLFVGSQHDEENLRNRDEWFVVHACKEPYHRQALGYTERGAPKGHPEYLLAKRENCLILNLVDVANPQYIPLEIMDTAVETIHEYIENKKILVHCNQGMSRSPSIALLYLAKYTEVFTGLSIEDARAKFRNLYPNYNPANGVDKFIQAHWSDFVKIKG